MEVEDSPVVEAVEAVEAAGRSVPPFLDLAFNNIEE